jgi:signal-transduction protein with cAMP-binding, CBS, and nucleotidyltransferase domain
MQHLLTQIKNFSPLSNETENALQDCFEKITLAKNDFLLQEGKICRHLYFLEKGALRVFIIWMAKK